MGQAKPTAQKAKKLQNRTMELALAKAGIIHPARTEIEMTNTPAVSATTVAEQVERASKAPLVVQPTPRARRKPRATDQEKARPKRVAERKKGKEAAKQAAAARLRLKVRIADDRERQRRNAERLAAIQHFVLNIENASFGELLSTWRKHVELVAFIRATGNNTDRLPLYEELVRTVEGEWHRRSRLPHAADEYFDWPTTDAKRGNGGLGGVYSVTEGVLGYLGYAVGEKSTFTRTQRQAILGQVFQMHLPPIESPTYMQEWATPGSAARLKKMADSIASFARQAKRRRNADMREAIASWEADLRMLHDEYYVGKFGFGWPGK